MYGYHPVLLQNTSTGLRRRVKLLQIQMSLRGVQGLTYCIAFFIVITIIVCLQYLPFSTDEYDYPDELENVLEFQLSKVMGKPLEKVNVDYTRNIHFSVKTSVKNYRTRLSLLLLTWFQTVEKDQVKIHY